MDRVKAITKKSMVTQQEILDDILWNLQWIGCNPEKTHPAYKLLFSYHFVTQTVLLLQVVALFLEETVTIKSLSSFVINATIVAQSLGKTTHLFLNRNTLLKISRTLKEIFWTADTFKEYTVRFQSNVTFAKTVFHYYRGILFIILVIFIIFPTISHQMVIPAWLPFDKALLQTSWPHLLGVNILQILTICNVGYFGLIHFDSLSGFLFVTVISQFKLLQSALQRINDIESNFSKQDIVRYVRYHKVLLGFVEDLATLLKFPILVQLSCSLLAMCTSTYLVTNSSDFTDTAMFLAYAFGSCFQIFLLCLAAQILQHESGLVAEAIYFSDWYKRYDKYFWNSAQFIIMRSEKTCVLTIWLVKLDLQLFIQICQLSFSMYTLLQNTNDRKMN